jgi:hypothetical protein
LNDGAGYTGSFTEIDSETGSVSDQDQASATDTNGAEIDGDHGTDQEHDGATSSYNSGGTYTDPTTSMTATVSSNDVTNDSIGMSDSDTDGASFASGSDTPSSDSDGDTDSMSDSGTDSATSTVTGTMAGGVTFGTTTSDTDGFTDTDHEQDGDNGVTDSASDNESGSDGGSETYVMHEGAPITDSSGGLDDATLSTDDSFGGLTGTYSLTDTMNDTFGDSGSGSVADSGSDTLTDASWSAGISGGDSGADDDHGGETITYNSNASGASGSFTDYEQDIGTYSDHDAGSDATVSDTATSQDTLTATDGGSVIHSYSSTENSTAAFNGTGTTTTNNTISESDSDAYGDTDVDAETMNAAGTVSPTSNDDTHTDDGQSSYSLNESINSHCSSISLTSSESEDGNGSYDDSSENVNGAVTFSNNDSGFSEGDSSSVSISASFGSSVTVADSQTTDDTYTYMASGSTPLDGSTGYTTLSYYDDSYIYDATGSTISELDVWFSNETITNINGGGADYTTDTTIYNDGSVVTGGGGDDGIGRFGGGGFGGGGFGGGGFHSDLYGGGGGTETVSESEGPTAPSDPSSFAIGGVLAALPDLSEFLYVRKPGYVPLQFNYMDEIDRVYFTNLTNGLKPSNMGPRLYAIGAANAMVGWRIVSAQNPNLIVNKYYITDDSNSPYWFLRYATRYSAQNSINLFFGHGGSVNKALNYNGLFKNVVSNNGLPLFGMSCCLASTYNGWIPKEFLIKNVQDNDGEVNGVEIPYIVAPMIMEADKIIKNRIQNGLKTEVNLFFGAFQDRSITLTPQGGVPDEPVNIFDRWQPILIDPRVFAPFVLPVF